MRDTAHLVVATYNIHGGRSSTLRYDIRQTLAVLQELDADVIALQEVDNRRHPGGGRSQLAFLADGLGMEAVAGPTIHSLRGEYGNAVLSRWPIRRHDRLNLSLPRREPRGALDVEVDWLGRPIRFLAAHLGLSRSERCAQTDWILAHLGTNSGPACLLGDFNWWLRANPGVRAIESQFPKAPALNSFPSRLPLAPIDRIWFRPAGALKSMTTHRTPMARRASDHLPVIATIKL